MAARKPDPTPLAAFLAPLARLATTAPDAEGQVIWASADGWQEQSDASELLDAEEIAFYAEGLLLEGFGLHWQICAETPDAQASDVKNGEAKNGEPKNWAPRLVRLFFWQDAPPLAAPLPAANVLIAEGRWPPTKMER